MSEYTIKQKLSQFKDFGNVKVTESSGKQRYVKKVSNEILTGIAADTSADLRTRLNAVAGAELEDDI